MIMLKNIGIRVILNNNAKKFGLTKIYEVDQKLEVAIRTDRAGLSSVILD